MEEEKEVKKEIKKASPFKKFSESFKEEFIPNGTLGIFSTLLVLGFSWVLQKFYSEMQLRDLTKLPKDIEAIISMVFQFALYAVIFVSLFGPVLVYANKTKKWESVVYVVLIELLFLAIFLGTIIFLAPKAAENPFVI